VVHLYILTDFLHS